MRRILLVILLIAAPVLGFGQTPEDDRGFITRMLEENLSGAGRDVRIDGGPAARAGGNRRDDGR